MTQLIISEGTKLFVGAFSPTAAAANGVPTVAEYIAAAGAADSPDTGNYANLDIVNFLQDLPTPDPTRTESRVPTLDAGEVVGAGTTTRTTMAFTALARKDNTAGYDAIKAAFKAKTTLTCLIVYTDNSRKWFQVHGTSAQESAPIGGNKQMAIGFAVQGEVVDVEAS